MMLKRYCLSLVLLVAFSILMNGEIYGQDSAKLSIVWETILPLAVRNISWSPDSQFLAFESDTKGNELTIYNVQDRTVVQAIVFSDKIDVIGGLQPVWSPDGAYIAVTRKGSLYIVDVKSAQIIQEYQVIDLIKQDASILQEARWIDNKSVATLNASGYVNVFDALSGKMISSFHLDTTDGGIVYTAFDWNDRNSLFAIPIFITNSIGFWRADGILVGDYYLDPKFKSRTLCFVPMERTNQINRIRWTSDGKRIAISADYGLSVCEITNEELYTTMTTFTDTSDPVNSFTWSPDGRWLLTSIAGTVGCRAKLYDAQNGFKLDQIIEGEACTFALEWSPDGNYIASGNVELRLGTIFLSSFQ